MTQHLQYKKSTKGTHVYQDDTPGAAITTVYVNKDAPIFTNPGHFVNPPKGIQIEVTLDEKPV